MVRRDTVLPNAFAAEQLSDFYLSTFQTLVDLSAKEA